MLKNYGYHLELDRLADDLLDFAEPADLQRWFIRYTTQ